MTSHPYSEFHPENHLLPRVSRAEFLLKRGFDLGWFLLEPINIARGPEDEIALSARFSPGQKALYFWWYLDAQVTNGGFIQFFYNRYGRDVPAILDGLDLIGHKEAWELLLQATAIQERHSGIFGQAEQDMEAFSRLYEEMPDLSALDDRYYALNKEIMGRLEAYIRANPDEFCLDENGESMNAGGEGDQHVYFEDGTLKESYRLVNGQIEGAYRKYAASGLLEAEFIFAAGEPTGERREWNAEGVLEEERLPAQTEGRFLQRLYHSNGNLAEEREVDSEGKAVGPYQEWYRDGTLREEGSYRPAEWQTRIGPWFRYWPNGNTKTEGVFNEEGKLTIIHYWNEYGEQLMKDGTGLYINEPRKILKREKQRRYETHYRNFKRHGLSREFEDGVLSRTEEYIDGILHGWVRNFDSSGELQSEARYENGELI